MHYFIGFIDINLLQEKLNPLEKFSKIHNFISILFGWICYIYFPIGNNLLKKNIQMIFEFLIVVNFGCNFLLEFNDIFYSLYFQNLVILLERNIDNALRTITQFLSFLYIEELPTELIHTFKHLKSRRALS